VGNVLQVKKNVFSEFFWHHWSKNARGYVANQALSACLTSPTGWGGGGQQICNNIFLSQAKTASAH
jgi:hypothetical protein